MNLTLYAVRNEHGQWFSGCDCWSGDVADARLYVKPSPARALVTYYANAHPNRPPPELV